MKKTILSILIAGVWITISEFIRNELLFKVYWINHFNSIGLKFETLPLNGILWMIWSFALAYLIFKLLHKFSIKESIFLAWLPAFLMMWITMYNLQTLPLALLLFAIPLSLLEVVISIVLIKKILK
jgi:hypothetical protein